MREKISKAIKDIGERCDEKVDIMKIFIGGSKMVLEINDVVKEKLNEFIKYGDEILIGDCWRIDTVVQEFFKHNNYNNVTVYASGDKVRNNVGQFKLRNIQTDVAKGFEFYRKKDVVMANEADCGFMIWDEKSKGTLSNIVDLVNLKKSVEIYLTNSNTFYVISADKLSRDKSVEALGGLVHDAYEDVMNVLK